jgi:hypothetical protein
MSGARGTAVGALALGLVTLVETLLVPRSAGAWLLHEHERISAAAIEKRLDDEDKETLVEAWKLALQTSDERKWLCDELAPERPITRTQNSRCVSYAALTALAGDHSCSPSDLLRSIRTGTWVSDVLHEADRLEGALERAGGSILSRIDERRVHDITLQLLDRDYLTRAKAGGAHFQLTRNDGGERQVGENKEVVLRQYLARVLATGQETNATALYVNYHASALNIAAMARDRCNDPKRLCATAADLIWRALVAESFALHFLEDAFSSGHFVGTWGDMSQRFGTHDYYCRHGANAVTFAGDTYVANGDLFLKDADIRGASRAAARSLHQVLHALKPNDSSEKLAEVDAALQRALPIENFDACIEERVPPGLEALASTDFIEEAVLEWPRPSLRWPELPRFRAEVGFFFGASLSGDAAFSASTSGAMVYGARVRPALRVGYGLEGAMSRYMDGRFFAELVGSGTFSSLDGEARLGVGARVHLPFAVLPGDGIFALGAAFGFQPSVWIARQASLGSVYGFERPILLGEANTLQITIGRDATFIVYPSTGSLTARRYELLLSVLDMTIGRAYSQQVANEVGLELGFQMIISKGDNVDRTFGGYLSLSTGSRVYP